MIMVKCSICKEKIPELFLGKRKGTIIKKPQSGTKYEVCFACQKKYRHKEEMLQQL